MSSRLRRELRIHRTVSGISLLGMMFLVVTAFQQPARGNLGEITVERINIVEKDGRTRLVISNHERQTPGRVNGKDLPARDRPAGLIFFNDEGDEDGGLIYSGRDGHAGASLTFDQYKQDQTLQLSYSEANGKGGGGLRMLDHTAIPLDEFLEKYAEAQRIPAGPQRTAALQAIGAPDNGASRVFVGKDVDGSSDITLSDRHGRSRLRMKVEAEGATSIEMLDENGKVVSRMPAR